MCGLCLVAFNSSRFNNDDALSHQVIMGIELVYLCEYIPLMQEGKT